jgi:tyrosinase
MASAFQPLIYPTSSYRERRNIRELEKAYQAGDKKPLCYGMDIPS